MPSKSWKLVAVVLFALSLLCATAAHAAEAFYRVSLNDLEVVKGDKPDSLTPVDWNWRTPTALQAYVVLEGQGEAYLLTNRSGTWRSSVVWRSMGRDNTALVIRTPEPREITGSLYIASTPATHADDQQAQTFHRVRFRIPADQASGDARPAFYRGMRNHYATLLREDVAGGAWFRHRLHEAQQALQDAGAGDANGDGLQQHPWLNAGNEDDLFAMFTGGRAVSENLQLDRLMPQAHGDAARLVKMDDIKGITVEPYKFTLPEDAQIKADPLASLVPFDQHVVFFRSFGALTQVTDMIEQHDTVVLNLTQPRSMAMNVGDFYRQQLCLPLSELARQLGPQVISSVAITGSDPYLPTGSDVAVLFESGSPTVLATFIQTRQQQAAQSYPESRAVVGRYQNVAYRGITTPGRKLSSYLVTLDQTVVVSNSLYQLQRIIDTHKGKVTSLATQDDYRFFRHRYPRGSNEETVLVLVPDAAIRRWCGPRWRIGAARRLCADALLADLQARYMDDVVNDAVKAGPIHTTLDIPGGIGELQLTGDGVRSSTYGTLEFTTPIAELDLDQVTQVEANRYRRWRDGYQQDWSNMYDPIALRLNITPQALSTDLTVMPLIVGSDFRQYMNFMQGASIDPDEGDPHPGTLLHMAVAINQESRHFTMAENYAGMFASTVGAQPLSWMGDTVAFYVEPDPIWQKLAKIGDDDARRRQFLEENFNRLPLALHIEVRNGLKAAAFLTALALSWRRPPRT